MCLFWLMDPIGKAEQAGKEAMTDWDINGKMERECRVFIMRGLVAFWLVVDARGIGI